MELYHNINNNEETKDNNNIDTEGLGHTTLSDLAEKTS